MPRGAPAYLEWLRVRTASLLRRPLHWAAVEKVAEALLDRKVLSSPQFRQIVRVIQRDFISRELAKRPPIEVRRPDGSTYTIPRALPDFTVRLSALQ